MTVCELLSTRYVGPFACTQVCSQKKLNLKASEPNIKTAAQQLLRYTFREQKKTSFTFAGTCFKNLGKKEKGFFHTDKYQGNGSKRLFDYFFQSSVMKAQWRTTQILKHIQASMMVFMMMREANAKPKVKLPGPAQEEEDPWSC